MPVQTIVHRMHGWRTQLTVKAYIAGDERQFYHLAGDLLCDPDLPSYYVAKLNFYMGVAAYENDDTKMARTYNNECLAIIRRINEKDKQLGEEHSADVLRLEKNAEAAANIIEGGDGGGYLSDEGSKAQSEPTDQVDRNAGSLELPLRQKGLTQDGHHQVNVDEDCKTTSPSDNAFD